MQTDNGKKIANKELSDYFENLEVEHVISTTYHLQSQVVIKTFIKIEKRAL